MPSDSLPLVSGNAVVTVESDEYGALALRAQQWLVSARSLSEIKEVRDRAEALRRYAALRGEHLALQNTFAELKLRAERRAGEVLDETLEEISNPSIGGNRALPSVGRPLQELGISKMQSSRWQLLSRVPEPVFAAHVARIRAKGEELTTAGLLALAKELERDRERATREAEATEEAATDPTGEVPTLLLGDFRHVGAEVLDHSIDLVLTDPPYHAEAVSEYGALAVFAARVLKPGGSLLAMIGQFHMPDALSLLKQHLAYHWTLAYLTPGGQSPQIWPRKVNTFWKPVVWLVKGEYEGEWHGDVIRSDVNDNDKRFHQWGQSESGVARLVEAFSLPGQRICDPMLGGGTTAVVASRLGRRFVGIDRDPNAVAATRTRLGLEIGSPDGSRQQLANGATGADGLAG